MNDFEWTYEVPTAPEQLTKENGKVGTVVRIAKTSEYYTCGMWNNPSDVDGVIHSTDLPGSYNICVYWETIYETNYYRYEDLVVIDTE